MGELTDRLPTTPRRNVAFVLGGGGLLGAAEVGMLRALGDFGIVPDLVLGTSVGALNGVVVADDPDGAADRLETLWTGIEASDPFGGSLFGRLATMARSGTHMHENTRLSRLLHASLDVRSFAQLTVEFQCVAACIETSSARWFTDGPLIPAVLASCAVPALLPPVEIDGRHYLDGGLVHSIPVGRAIDMGATEVFVLHVGRIEQPLAPPANPWEVGVVAFEIARRHRFVEEMASVADHLDVHVLPTGDDAARAPTDPRQLRYRDTGRVTQRIEQAYRAATTYLTFRADASTRSSAEETADRRDELGPDADRDGEHEQPHDRDP